MSGILLPGQENEPEEQPKIEIPSGYTRPKPSEAPDKEEAEVGPETPAEGDAAGQPREAESPAGGQTPKLLFPPQGVQVQCPSCGSPYVVPVFSIVDLGANPELRTPLLSGQINVGVCQNCGAGGQLSAPLMVHDPEHEFLGVYVPMEGLKDDLQQQQVIGELTRALMAKIPSESQRGYMLQPRAFMDLERMMEKLWEFEGVTPEMLRRQRDQQSLLQRLLGLVDDDTALDLALERRKELVDREFFTMLDQILLLARSQDQESELDKLRLLRDKLIERTEAGQQVKQQAERIQALLEKVNEETTREELLEIVVDAWQEEDAERLVGTFAMMTGVSADYEFLMQLAQRIDETEEEETRAKLEELRQFLLRVQDQIAAQQRENQGQAAQEAQELLQKVLQATDTEAALREHVDQLDETFLALLAEHIRRMEEAGSEGAATRLTRVYQQALAILQEQMPEDMQLLNQLIMAPDDATVRKLLRENRNLVTPDFLANMKTFEQQTRANGRPELADRLKSIHGQARLML